MDEEQKIFVGGNSTKDDHFSTSLRNLSLKEGDLVGISARDFNLDPLFILGFNKRFSEVPGPQRSLFKGQFAEGDSPGIGLIYYAQLPGSNESSYQLFKFAPDSEAVKLYRPKSLVGKPVGNFPGTPSLTDSVSNYDFAKPGEAFFANGVYVGQENIVDALRNRLDYKEGSTYSFNGLKDMEHYATVIESVGLEKDSFNKKGDDLSSKNLVWKLRTVFP